MQNLNAKKLQNQNVIDNYRSRGFVTAANHGILPGETVHLPHIDCLMVKELVPGALENMSGTVEYDFYETLKEE